MLNGEVMNGIILAMIFLLTSLLTCTPSSSTTASGDLDRHGAERSDDNEMKNGNENKPALKVLVSVDKEKYKVGDQIELTVSLLNVSNQTLFFYGYLSWGYSSSFTLLVTDLTGREIMPEGLDDSITPPPPPNDKSVFVKLNPKHFLGVTRIQALKELNIDRPGKYKVAVDYHSPIPESFGQGLPIWSREMGTVASEPIQIEVSAVN
jgi:hypothetical protein